MAEGVYLTGIEAQKLYHVCCITLFWFWKARQELSGGLEWRRGAALLPEHSDARHPLHVPHIHQVKHPLRIFPCALSLLSVELACRRRPCTVDGQSRCIFGAGTVKSDRKNCECGCFLCGKISSSCRNWGTRCGIKPASARAAASAVSSTSAGASSRSFIASAGPKRRSNSKSLAHTMQWMGFSGVLRMVQMGKPLAAGLRLHSKHSVLPFM